MRCPVQTIWKGALQVYRKVLSIDPTNTEAHRCLASLLRRTGRQAEAIDVLSSWLKLEPDNPVARHLLVGLYQPGHSAAGFRRICAGSI